MKDKEIMIHWMEQGSTSVPNVLLENYKKLSLNEQEMMLLLHIYSYSQKGILFPSFEELSNRMSITASECAGCVKKLLQKQVVEIEQGSQTGYESYSLEPLWNKLVALFESEARGQSVQQAMTEEKDLYSLFEEEFGRPLSSIECETLALWIDQDGHSPSVIKAALREAVLSMKLNFRYIDRILFEWKKQGIKTVEQAREQGKKFRKPAAMEQVSRSEQAVPFYNWLEQ
ncbi:DnaD domain-containing protein [Domibacillus enclensis]|uniref:DNA replication protein DnaD n=1 Tax=Domibacillus enclensis TaxID=1017273 RepID=A0A1N6P5L4_9BACI|nr:DnaD domain-containing protein [Domibacillus enclensis]OXS80248.1 DNA replication protein DnaD [Domibacillus enclensis]SIP99599.1 DNA replication protein DnaD [Domibacillus enclensis]